MRNGKNKQKLECPLYQEQCHGSSCAWFHKDFEKCQIELISWNMYALTRSMTDCTQAITDLEGEHQVNRRKRRAL